MDFSRPDNARRINRLKVLEALRGNDLSRAELSRELLINKVSISEITEALLSEGLIETGAMDTSTSGRPATKLSIAKGKGRVFSFIFSASSVVASASDLTGNLLRFEKFPLETAKDSMDGFIRKMTADGGKVYGATVIADDKTKVPSTLFSFPVLYTSRILAAARAQREIQPDLKKCIFLHWSDSISAAWKDTRETIQLPYFPHMKVTKGVKCACGGDGCLEAVASGKALKEMTALAKYKDILSDKKGQMAVYDVSSGMAFALSEAAQALGADTIFVTGEMASMNGELAASLSDMVRTALPPTRDLEVGFAAKGENLVLEGAGILALDRFFYHSDILKDIEDLQSRSLDID